MLVSEYGILKRAKSCIKLKVFNKLIFKLRNNFLYIKLPYFFLKKKIYILNLLHLGYGFHEGSINCMAFKHNENLILTGSEDGTSCISNF